MMPEREFPRYDSAWGRPGEVKGDAGTDHSQLAIRYVATRGPVDFPSNFDIAFDSGRRKLASLDRELFEFACSYSFAKIERVAGNKLITHCLSTY